MKGGRWPGVLLARLLKAPTVLLVLLVFYHTGIMYHFDDCQARRRMVVTTQQVGGLVKHFANGTCRVHSSTTTVEGSMPGRDSAVCRAYCGAGGRYSGKRHGSLSYPPRTNDPNQQGGCALCTEGGAIEYLRRRGHFFSTTGGQRSTASTSHYPRPSTGKSAMISDGAVCG